MERRKALNLIITGDDILMVNEIEVTTPIFSDVIRKKTIQRGGTYAVNYGCGIVLSPFFIPHLQVLWLQDCVVTVLTQKSFSTSRRFFWKRSV